MTSHASNERVDRDSGGEAVEEVPPAEVFNCQRRFAFRQNRVSHMVMLSSVVGIRYLLHVPSLPDVWYWRNGPCSCPYRFAAWPKPPDGGRACRPASTPDVPFCAAARVATAVVLARRSEADRRREIAE